MTSILSDTFHFQKSGIEIGTISYSFRDDTVYLDYAELKDEMPRKQNLGTEMSLEFYENIVKPMKGVKKIMGQALTSSGEHLMQKLGMHFSGFSPFIGSSKECEVRDFYPNYVKILEDDLEGSTLYLPENSYLFSLELMDSLKLKRNIEYTLEPSMLLSISQNNEIETKPLKFSIYEGEDKRACFGNEFQIFAHSDKSKRYRELLLGEYA